MWASSERGGRPGSLSDSTRLSWMTSAIASIRCSKTWLRAASAMWKIARYAIEGANVVGVGTFPKHSTLFFYRGRELDDGTGLLQGSGKDTRFITLRTPADADLPAVRKLVRKAFKLGGAPTTAH